MKLYTVVFSIVAVTAQQDLFAIVAASSKSLCVHGFELGQSTEFGDAQDEDLAILVKRGASTVGSGGSAPTPIPLELGQGAASFTARVNDTTPASSGTIVNLHATAWNVRSAPTTWLYPPELRPWCAVSERLVVGLVSTPADSINMSGTMWVEEIG